MPPVVQWTPPNIYQLAWLLCRIFDRLADRNPPFIGYKASRTRGRSMQELSPANVPQRMISAFARRQLARTRSD
ncbi:hypothetical protein B1C78_03700 [Thioalkalivibrio denitrificans]|uniref:Uncharacterized protein n=1 Tax=Thioalkalivibrio denitrificans TaxID=108003 RepID=A0A1V3NR02_9GAMM|nr:hypothetical protein B1C78_03700 [Thioalkalivibrio denitrificans]